MGVGKTTIGKLVAKKLYRTFVDIDEEIEKIHGMKTVEIFNEFGEKYFREFEKKTITDIVTQHKLQVISLGGGAFLNEEIRRLCLANCMVFNIDLSWDSWKERIDILIDSRPVLQNKSLDEIEKLFKERQDAYSYHNSKIQSDNLEPEKVADYIAEAIKFAWDFYS